MTGKTQVFDERSFQYDSWFDRHPFVFQSEVEALRAMLPEGLSHGIEVGLGTGRFSLALGIKEGVEPSDELRQMAVDRGIEVMPAVAEDLPYKDLKFDFVLMASCVSYFTNVQQAFNEALRVLKPRGCLILGHIEKGSIIAQEYEARRQVSAFYKEATFYSTDSLIERMKSAGFKSFEISQTLFDQLDMITELQPAIEGHGKGSYVVIKAIRK